MSGDSVFPLKDFYLHDNFAKSVWSGDHMTWLKGLKTARNNVRVVSVSSSCYFPV